SPCAPLDEALRAAIHSRAQADHLRNTLAPALIELLASMVPALRKSDLHQDAPPRR
ncbi:MAG: hypothetical protein HC853_10630, partial [Anaerolineae bacterium]|nr:hypothetical protein [Anaerolineae bacterium]